jgi:hypothetical protein
VTAIAHRRDAALGCTPAPAAAIVHMKAGRLALPLCLVATLAGVALASACSSSHAGPSGAVGADAAASADAGPPPLEPSPPEPVAPGARLDQASSPVVFDRLRGGVWTANGDVGSVSYADIVKQAVVFEVAVGKDVTSVALSPDGAWLAAVDRAGASVSLLEGATGKVARAIALGTHPRAAVWDAWDPRWLYVSEEDDGAIAIVDRTRGVLDHTVPVGRLPAGIASSRLRRELAVAHRIDGAVSILSLDGVYAPADQGATPVDVPLALQPPVSDDTQPNGTPFALESLAWTADGDRLWVPHELLSNHHPFQFQRQLFPAVSVVDETHRAEVQTDPNDPLGVIAGRKLLFGAINIPDAERQHVDRVAAVRGGGAPQRPRRVRRGVRERGPPHLRHDAGDRGRPPARAPGRSPGGHRARRARAARVRDDGSVALARDARHGGRLRRGARLDHRGAAGARGE